MSDYSIDQMMDYMFCPMYYQLRYEKGYPVLDEIYHGAILRCIKGYLNKKRAHSPVGEDFLRTKWGEAWIGKQPAANIALAPTTNRRKRYDQKRINGIEMLHRFFQVYDKKISCPILTAKQWTIRFSSFSLSGIWESVEEVELKNGERGYEILYYSTKASRYFTNNYCYNQLNLVAGAYAFRTIFKQTESVVTFFDLSKKKYVSYSLTEQDFAQFKQTVQLTKYGIEHRLFPKCPSEKCYTCPLRKICEKQ